MQKAEGPEAGIVLRVAGGRSVGGGGGFVDWVGDNWARPCVVRSKVIRDRYDMSFMRIQISLLTLKPGLVSWNF